MADSEKTKAELRAEIQSLKARLAEERSPASESSGGPHRGDDPGGDDSAGTDPVARTNGVDRLVDHLPEAVLVVGEEDQVCYANRAAVRMVKADSRECLLESPISAYVRPSGPSREAAGDEGSGVPRARLDAALHDASGRRRRAGRRSWATDQGQEPTRLTAATLLCDDGSTMPVEVASVPIRYGGTDARLAAVRDLRGQQRMARTITRTLQLFDKAFHLGPAALLIVRLDDGMILEVSARVMELSGLDAHALIGRSVAEVNVGLDDATRTDVARTLVEEGAVSGRELSLHTTDGEERVVLCSARLADIDGDACALVSLVDITRRKQATLAEQESRTLLHKIFRASPAPIAIYGLDDERYIDVNEAMCSLIGYPHDEIVAQTPAELDIWVDEDRRRELMRRLRERDAVYDFKARFRTSSGDVVTTLSSYQRIRVEGRDCVLAVMTDITQHEDAREALVQAKEKADEARKKAEDVAQFRSSVLSNMTHEVRTPLTVILGFTSMLREGVEPEYKRFVNLIERSGQRLLLTLDSLLDLAQLEAGTLEVDDSVESIPDAVHSLTGTLKSKATDKDLAFDLEVPAADRRLCARIDQELFGRVLSHLVDNAVKFTSDGTITVRVDGTDDTVTVAVSDTGSGISDEFLPRIFEAFAQESEGNTRSHQGSGLGLTVSKRIVERMDGRIDIDSTKGEGTTVTVILPRACTE